MEMKYTHAISFLWVKDWQRAIDFYKDVLGLKKVYESDGWAEFSIPGIKDTYIALNKWGQEGNPPTDTFITLGVNDLSQFKGQLESKSVKLKGDIVTFEGENQGMRMLKFFDSEGNVLTAAETFES